MPFDRPDPANLTDLLQQLRTLHAAVQEEGAARLRRWEPYLQRPDFTDSARNMAYYLALRGHDLTGLQPCLTALGLSSLGRCEAHVLASLQAAMAALGAVAGDPQSFPDPDSFAAPGRRLEARRDAAFGAGATTSGADGDASAAPAATRIMVTLPTEAAGNPDKVAHIVAAGADCLRINCAHDDPAAWARMLAHRDEAAAQAGRPVPVEMDLGGPKLRIATVVAGKERRLQTDDTFSLVRDAEAKGKRPRLVLDEPQVFDALQPDIEVWIDDGKLRARVEAVAEDHVLCRITSAPAKGWKPKPEKGVNLIGVDLDLPALTDADRAALPFVAGHADLIAYSFVQTVKDVTELIAALYRAAPDRQPVLVLKIETLRALRNLPDLIAAAGGRMPVAVMIARGDLAVEIGFARLSEIQEEILWLCEAAHVPVIWATQVLEGLVKEGQATRPETTDAAMSQRAECVMLNKGPHIVAGVRFLRDVLSRMDRHARKKDEAMGPLGLWQQPD